MTGVTDTIILDEREITERFVRAAGPGGQNVIKVATAVELRVDIPRSSLSPDVKERLIALAGRHVTTDGCSFWSAACTVHKRRIVTQRRRQDRLLAPRAAALRCRVDRRAHR
jgi:ribosome-associated protein